MRQVTSLLALALSSHRARSRLCSISISLLSLVKRRPSVSGRCQDTIGSPALTACRMNGRGCWSYFTGCISSLSLSLSLVVSFSRSLSLSLVVSLSPSAARASAGRQASSIKRQDAWTDCPIETTLSLFLHIPILRTHKHIHIRIYMYMYRLLALVPVRSTALTPHLAHRCWRMGGS